jgi:hypothetical protein
MLKEKIKIGNIFPTNKCGMIEILEVNDWKNVKIKFLDTGWETTVYAGNILTKEVRDPTKALVHGVGYQGVGKHMTSDDKGKMTPAYATWNGMLKRCYKPRSIYNIINYEDVTVCSEWFNFQNFADWYETNLPNVKLVGSRWEIDKDLLIPRNKVYGPDRCCIIPNAINSLFLFQNKISKLLPLGVRHNGYSYVAYEGHSYIGSFKTVTEAQLAYWSVKFEAIRSAAIHYWQYLPEPLAWRLLTFDWADAHAYYGDDAIIRF